MLHNRSLNNRINIIYERALRIVYNDKTCTFEALLLKDKSVTIHQRNMQHFAILLKKIKLGIAPSLLNDIFETYNPNYDLRNAGQFAGRIFRTYLQDVFAGRICRTYLQDVFAGRNAKNCLSRN